MPIENISMDIKFSNWFRRYSNRKKIIVYTSRFLLNKILTQSTCSMSNVHWTWIESSKIIIRAVLRKRSRSFKWCNEWFLMKTTPGHDKLRTRSHRFTEVTKYEACLSMKPLLVRALFPFLFFFFFYMNWLQVAILSYFSSLLLQYKCSWP